MCLYPRIMKNPKYKENSKNGGIIIPPSDLRQLYLSIGCGQCMECRKAKARHWQNRLHEDIKTHTNGKFITLTFSNESIKHICNLPPTKNWPSIEGLTGYERDNEIATRAVHLFRERWRKKYKRSIRHWLVTEIGHRGTENIHLHGIIWTNEILTEVENHWQYGWIWKGKLINGVLINYVNARTVNYIIKYVHKLDYQHKHFRSKVLTSPGIGGNYTNTHNAKRNTFNGENTIETYKTCNGTETSLPIYWRNKIYSEEQREKLWTYKLNKEQRFVGGEKVDVSENNKEYFKLLAHYRLKNHELGYGTGYKDWDRAEYEKQRREMMHGKRTI